VLRRPQVALESTLYAFGLPKPKNVQVAWTLARAVSATGAEARTFAVIDGEIKVGLHDDELERICEGEGVVKLNASDLGPSMALGLTGATTVSATCALAHGAGIKVFATGGIGGVHRGAETTFDESQDLAALARYPVAVVSAGAKAILDLPKTLERLESLGVPVIGYQTDAFPAFYTREAGDLKVQHRVDDIPTLARLLAAHWRVHPRVGVLVANPIPEAAALSADEVDGHIQQALEEAAQRGHRGQGADALPPQPPRHPHRGAQRGRQRGARREQRADRRRAQRRARQGAGSPGVKLGDDRRLILASASSARRRLLARAGLAFEIVPADIDESPRPAESLVERAHRLAEHKAMVVSRNAPGATVIGADQVGYLLSSRRELTRCATAVVAREQLAAMAGRSHRLISAAAVVRDGELIGTAEEKATVVFKPLSPDDIEAYLATDEWRGTCGAYRLEGEGASLVSTTDGPRTAILGLPLSGVLELLQRP
jgi:pseudouridine-5'-phosphate glycosidase